ncbi:HlyD family secretion protein [Duganella violaceipulchra]|uniref:HlyD family efflux transporter periplasmic adaptor subunit n=1 Tax=Duganella violaceipulchra TaxID=2849652 RepID=A0AA41HBA7_9BURK|nr:HlyD family efflux transporter periplasmic adaptor subunit [Duganella violaceicalia]MBV6320618.1 HlyD family efflux transporter periplasmic adaptor subunit [Duganella violaceicalia]MCP2008673.1 membrane fusion protein [Duganella violaceicalia]
MRSAAIGQLMPVEGLIRILPKFSAEVREKRIIEGQHVQQGDVLFILSGERNYAVGAAVQSTISAQIQTRRLSLSEDVTRTAAMHRAQLALLKRQENSLLEVLGKLQSQIEARKARVAIFEKAARRFQSLQEQSFVSAAQTQEKLAALLEEQAALLSLGRDYEVSTRELSEVRSNLASLPLQQAKELAAIERSIEATKQEFIESESRRQEVVTAPVSGTVTVITAEAGQSVDPSRPLVSIVPDNSQLEARLFVGSKSVGFIRNGDTVKLRYQAFPYQKFGHAQGTVLSVSRAAAPSGELGGVGNLPGVSPSEPLYAVRVCLERQDVLAYGKREPLVTGMQVDADILQSARHLHEWVLDPLYSITGRM